jgi:hypothetical protein
MKISEKVRAWAPVFLLVFAAAVNLYSRIRLINLPFNRDEGIWAYAAQALSHGVPMYASILDTKLPGITVIYWLFFALFGQEIWPVRLSVIITIALTALYIYMTASRLFSKRSGIISAAAYLMMSMNMAMEGMFAYTEHYAMLFIVMAVYHAFRSKDSGFLINGAVAGLYVSLAIMVKQQVLPIAVIPAVIYIMASGKKRLLRGLAVFSSAFLVPFAGLIIYLAASHMFANFIELIVKYGSMYSSLINIDSAAKTLSYFVLFVTPWQWAFPVIGGAVYMAEIFKKEKARGDILLLFFLPVAFIAVSAGFMYRTHYFIFMLPAIAMLCGICEPKPEWLSDATIGVMILASFYAVYMERGPLFSYSHEKYLKGYYGQSPFYESIKISEYLKQHTSPEDKIAVLGSEPQIYFYSGRRAVSNFTVVYFMMWAGKKSRELELETIREIEEEKPKYLVFVNIDVSWGVLPDSDRAIFEWFRNKRDKQFTLECVAELKTPDVTNYYYGENARKYKQDAKNLIYVYRTNF